MINNNYFNFVIHSVTIIFDLDCCYGEWGKLEGGKVYLATHATAALPRYRPFYF